MQLVAFNFTGDGATHPLADAAAGVPKKCKWFQITLQVASLTGLLNIGGASTDASNGYPIGVTGANFQPPIALAFEFYDLTQTYYYLGAGDEAVLLCAI